MTKNKLSDFGEFRHQEHNPRQWTKTDIDRLNKSLSDFGDLSGIVHDLNSGQIVSGNFRSEIIGAVEHPQDCEIEITHTNEAPDAQGTVAIGYIIWNGFRYNYRQVRWSKEQCEEACIKANYLGGSTDWDEMANYWSAKYEDALLDWGVSGWPTEETTEGTGSGSESGNAQDDDFDEDEGTIEVKCKRGDIWQLGEHRLMCGDSVNLDEVKRLMGGALADMCFTDPPYGVSIGSKNEMLNTVQPSGRCCKNIENDTLSSDELYPVLVAAMTNTRLSCKDDASYYVTSPQGGELGLMMMMMKDAGLTVRHMLIWVKNCATFSLGRLDYDYQHEPIFYTWTKKHHNYRGGENRTTIWQYDKPRKCDLHPTMKPVPLVANCLMDATKEGDNVIDLFGGSGTTLIACEQLKRKCFMMELDPHYCDVIIARWEKLTGKTAIKLNGQS